MGFNGQMGGVERFFSADEVIVSKTDVTGRLTYANDIFLGISGYAEEELLGAQHSIIRHPDMPRAVFKLLWERIRGGNEIFAAVLNSCKNGDYYWVLAHVTPNRAADDSIIGFHSSRRVPSPALLATVKPLYAQLRRIERANPDSKAGLEESSRALAAAVAGLGFDSYDRFIFSLGL